MNGYIEVNYGDSRKNYTYMIPDHIKINQIQKWVVVENAFYRKGDCPYCVVQVVAVHNKYWKNGNKATKYIVDTINGSTYRDIRKKQNIENMLDTKLKEKFDDVFNNMSMEEKFNFIFNNENNLESILPFYTLYKTEIGD